MQIRCTNCHKPFALGKEEIYSALDLVSTDGLHHYDAHCPHCRRVNRVSPKELRRGAPGWKKGESD
jgi:phage FluMu protein Com